MDGFLFIGDELADRRSAKIDLTSLDADRLRDRVGLTPGGASGVSPVKNKMKIN